MSEMQITEPGMLHDETGVLTCPGFAYKPLLTYDRSRIAAPKHRIKEWDYYLVNDDRYAACMTLGDLGYMGLLSVSLIDFRNKTFVTSSEMVPLPLGRFHMPADSDSGVAQFSNHRCSFKYETRDGERHVCVDFKKFNGDDGFYCDVVLDEQPEDSMVIATPWAEDPHAFYYNRKILGMRARGVLKSGNIYHVFDPQSSFGLLDWGRGVWTRDNHWFWAYAQGWQDGRGGNAPGSFRVSINLGYGFGDTSAASENMFFINGKAIKLGVVKADIPITADYLTAKKTADRFHLMEPWHISDEEETLELVFTPEIDRQDYMNLGLVVSDQHQIFGTYDGTLKMNGEVFVVKNLKGAAEVIHNKY